jgi:arsenite transporter
MTAQCDVTAKRAAGVQMNVFERYLTLWVFLCILAGIGLGISSMARSRPSAGWRSPRSTCRWRC